jgi:hypothetical protein
LLVSWFVSIFVFLNSVDKSKMWSHV